MVEVTLQSPALSRLRRRFLQAPSVVQTELARSLREVGDAAVSQVQGRTPVRTGRLKASVTATVSGSGVFSELKVSSVVPYAPFIERGTRRGIRGRFMFREGLRATEPEAKRIFGNAIRRIVRRVARGG